MEVARCAKAHDKIGVVPRAVEVLGLLMLLLIPVSGYLLDPSWGVAVARLALVLA